MMVKEKPGDLECVLLDAMELLSQSARQFRAYEKQHRSKIKPLPDYNDFYYNAVQGNNEDAKKKADVNADMAARIEAFLNPIQPSNDNGRVATSN